MVKFQAPSWILELFSDFSAPQNFLFSLVLEQGYDEEEIKRKVASYREILKEKDPTMNKVGKSDYDSGKTKAESSHEIAKLNADQQEKLKNAFGISKDYKPGQAFANKLGSDIMKDKGPDGNGKSGFKAPRMPGNKRAPEGIPGHMVNQVPDQKEQFRSKYDELDSESSSSDSSDSDSSDSSDSEDDHKKEGDGDSSSTDEEEERRKEKKRKRRRREKEKAKQRELLRKSRKRQQKEENEIKEEAASLRASRAASEAPSNYSNMPTGGGGYINPDYVPPEQQYESPHWPIHKRRKERGESQVRNDNYYRESRDRYNGNRGHENYPKYDEFARQSRNREYRGSQVRGQGYDDRAQYREMYGVWVNFVWWKNANKFSEERQKSARRTLEERQKRARRAPEER